MEVLSFRLMGPGHDRILLREIPGELFPAEPESIRRSQSAAWPGIGKSSDRLSAGRKYRGSFEFFGTLQERRSMLRAARFAHYALQSPAAKLNFRRFTAR